MKSTATRRGAAFREERKIITGVAANSARMIALNTYAPDIAAILAIATGMSTVLRHAL
jgi:hypothetical protein